MTSIFDYKKSPSLPTPKTDENSDFLQYKNPKNIQQYSSQHETKKQPISSNQNSYEQILESEDLEKEIERHSARSLSRMGERILGLPGDLIDFTSSVFGLPDDLLGLSKRIFPSSQALKKFSEKSTLGYTKAKNKEEEFSDELMGDIGSMMLPAGRSGSVAQSLGKQFAKDISRTVGIPMTANISKEVLKEGGMDESSSQWSKMGIMFMLDMLGKRAGGAKKYIGDLFQKSKGAIPTGTTVPVPNLVNAMNNLKIELQRGGTSSPTSKALQKVNEIEGKIQNGMMDPQEFPAFRKTINSAIDDLGGWDMATSPANRRQAIKHLNEVKDAVVSEGIVYGQTNPAFLEPWQQANEAAAVAGKSNKISNFIEKVVGKKAGNTVKTLFGIGGAGTLLSPGSALIATAGTVGYQAFKLLYRVINSPTLAKYYKGVMTAAAKENASQVLGNSKALEQKLKEEDEQEKKKIKKLIK